jgi:hypothetical protein
MREWRRARRTGTSIHGAMSGRSCSSSEPGRRRWPAETNWWRSLCMSPMMWPLPSTNEISALAIGGGGGRGGRDAVHSGAYFAPALALSYPRAAFAALRSPAPHNQSPTAPACPRNLCSRRHEAVFLEEGGGERTTPTRFAQPCRSICSAPLIHMPHALLPDIAPPMDSTSFDFGSHFLPHLSDSRVLSVRCILSIYAKHLVLRIVR